ncbi:GtrA family protein [Pseudomonas entomophila]|uniref:GtrA family protein n=1 Tax=Pseudomonas entomophila TaxID=312306 RepID=UPI0023D8A7F5|nr:GtrA family protein [Pseudomonas entomophila]MDF0731556.1 GtrA family protein [Pseudomonas entomophila]
MTKTSILRPAAIVPALTRYLGVGMLATLVHQLVFVLALQLGQPLLGSVIGAAIGALTSFLLARGSCFAGRGGRRLQPRKFVCVALLHNLCNALAMAMLLRATPLAPFLAQALTTGSLALVVFFIHRHWTHSHVDLPLACRGH